MQKRKRSQLNTRGSSLGHSQLVNLSTNTTSHQLLLSTFKSFKISQIGILLIALCLLLVCASMHSVGANLEEAPQEGPPEAGLGDKSMAASQERQTGGERQLAARPVRIQRRKPRLYRIRATQAANGRFGPPVRVVELAALQQSRANEAEEAREFGVRTAQRAKPTASSAQEPCQQQATAAGDEATSIAASSQTLRLFGVNSRPLSAANVQSELQVSGTKQEQVNTTGGQHEVEEAEHSAAPSSSGSTTAARDTRLRPAEHHEQSEAGDGGEQLVELAEEQRNSSPSARKSILSLIDEFDSKISTNRTKAQLSCDSGEMILRLNFSEPFRGIVYPDHNRLSPCRFFGDGHLNYELRLPLKGCGTRQIAQRVFVNDVIVRFHRSLELEEDEVKTLICRYPAQMVPLLSGGKALLHELDATTDLRQASANSPTGYSSGGGANEAPSTRKQQFEFVDPVRGRIVTTGGTEGAHPQRSQPIRLRPTQPGGIITANDLLEAPPRPTMGADGSLVGSSQLLPTTTIGSGSERNSSSLLDNLSSVELLFLISSLMFLVLLALGLAASYLCLSGKRRRSVGRATPYVVPKVLRTRPPPLPVVGSVARAHKSTAAAVGRRPPTQHYNWSRAHYQVPARSCGAPVAQYRAPDRGQQQQQLAGSSSPDDATSDMSALVLLPGGQQQQLHNSLGRRHRQLMDEIQRQRPLVLGRRSAQQQHQHQLAQQHSTLARRQHNRTLLEQNLLRASAREPLLEPGDSKQRQQSGAQLRAQSMQTLPMGAALQPAAKPLRVRQWQTTKRTEDNRPSAQLQDYGLLQQPPRLVLKSIDDTFITKLTEVHEQEYMKRDALDEPLGWAQWAAAASLGARHAPAKPQSRASSSASLNNDQDHEHRQPASNMRSLTELDVNFAKSLRRERATSEANEPPASDKADLVISSEYDCSATSSPEPVSQPNTLASKQANTPEPGGGRIRLASGRSPSAQSHESISYV